MNNKYKSKVYDWLFACQYFDNSANTCDINADGEILLSSNLNVTNARLNREGAIPFNIGYCKELSMTPGNEKSFLKFMNLETLPKYCQALSLHYLHGEIKRFHIEKEHFYDRLLISTARSLSDVIKVNAHAIELCAAHNLASIDLLPNTCSVLFRNCNIISMSDIVFHGTTLKKLLIVDCSLNTFKGFPKHVEELTFSTHGFFCASDITELEKTNITQCTLTIPNLASGMLSILEITKNIKVKLEKENTQINQILNTFLVHDKPYEYIMDCTVLYIDSGLGDLL